MKKQEELELKANLAVTCAALLQHLLTQMEEQERKATIKTQMLSTKVQIDQTGLHEGKLSASKQIFKSPSKMTRFQCSCLASYTAQRRASISA